MNNLKNLAYPLFLMPFSVIFNSFASASVDIAVYATQKNNGAISFAQDTAYTKTFDIMLVKLSPGDADLKGYCLKAYSPDGAEYQLDTVDEVLVSGTLQNDKSKRGTAAFISESPDIHHANLVKITDKC